MKPIPLAKLPFAKTDYRRQKARRKRDRKLSLIEWHELVCERAREGTKYRCHHCQNLFDRDRVCGDHYPYSRGARPDLLLDPENGVCSCGPCNTSNAPTRRLFRFGKGSSEIPSGFVPGGGSASGR